MEHNGKTDAEQSKIAMLLGNYLRLDGNSLASDGPHLDEDSMSALVDGTLSQREAQPIVNHLVDCSFCRKVTAELLRLDLAFAEESVPVAIETSAPVSVSEVLSGILGRVFGKNDGVVFAHQESDEGEEEHEPENDQKDD